MANVAARVEDAALISLLVSRLGRLVRLKRTLEGASAPEQHRVVLARLDQADLAVAILARGRRGRRPRRGAPRARRTALDRVLDDPARC